MMLAKITLDSSARNAPSGLVPGLNQFDTQSESAKNSEVSSTLMLRQACLGPRGKQLASIFLSGRSHDGQYIYFDTTLSEDAAFFRVRISDHKVERPTIRPEPSLGFGT